MLIVFRIVLPAAFTPGLLLADGAVFSLGRAVVLPPVVDGRLDVEGARSPLLDNPPARRLEAVGTRVPVLLRVFGRAGRALVGGPYDGPDDRGRDAAMLCC